MNLSSCVLKPTDEKSAEIISEWEYPHPYDVYNFKNKNNGYLFDRNLWGTEQFCLICGNDVIGQVACQYDNGNLWVGWSLAPVYCGIGNGYLFIGKCIEEIRRVKQYNGILNLRVAAWNERAIKAYKKAGFVYVKTITDEIANTNNPEDFHLMKQILQERPPHA